MVKMALPLLVVIFLVGCKGSVVETREEARKNRELLLSLDIGMTQDEVLATMGKPKKTKVHSTLLTKKYLLRELIGSLLTH